MENILQPYIWMLKKDNFKKSYFMLVSFSIIFTLVAVVLRLLSNSYLNLSFYFNILSYICFILVIFFLSGYFWLLVRNVISRTVDIAANNIYSGKIKNVFLIDLPDFNIFKIFTRGFSSIVALALLIMPYILLLNTTIYTDSFYLPMQNIDAFHKLYQLSYNLLYVIFYTFIPALLWSYGKHDSIVAVWNISEAVHILGTYFWRYVFYLLYLYIINFLIVLSVYSIINFMLTNFSGIILILSLVLLTVLGIFALVYYIFVLAYLLGVLAPADES